MPLSKQPKNPTYDSFFVNRTEPHLYDSPEGLEKLWQVEKLHIRQDFVYEDCLSTALYEISDSNTRKIYYAYENSDYCCKTFCFASYKSTIYVLDSASQEVLMVNLTTGYFEKWCCCGFLFSGSCKSCSTEATIKTSSDDETLGTVEQKYNIKHRNYILRDPNGNVMFEIIAPNQITSACCGKTELQITKDEKIIGKIYKQTDGCLNGKKFNEFDIEFPRDIPVRSKAIILGAWFLIVTAYYKFN